MDSHISTFRKCGTYGGLRTAKPGRDLVLGTYVASTSLATTVMTRYGRYSEYNIQQDEEA